MIFVKNYIDLLQAVRKGELPCDEAIIREIAQLVRRVPVTNSDRFLEQYRNVGFSISNVK